MKPLLSGLTAVALVAGCGGGDSPDAVLDASAGTYGGVGLDSTAADVRSRGEDPVRSITLSETSLLGGA